MDDEHALTGAGVHCYVLDSGINLDHNEFRDRYCRRLSNLSSSTLISSCMHPSHIYRFPQGRCLYICFVGTLTAPMLCDSFSDWVEDSFKWDAINNRRGQTDETGHGTHVAGIIAGEVYPGYGAAASMIHTWKRICLIRSDC